jgi:hypothetical protein
MQQAQQCKDIPFVQILKCERSYDDHSRLHIYHTDSKSTSGSSNSTSILIYIFSDRIEREQFISLVV